MGWETYDEDMKKEAENNPEKCSNCGNYMTWTIYGWECTCNTTPEVDSDDDNDPCCNCHPATEFACIGCIGNR